LRISEADRAVQVTVASYLNEGEAGMLFVVWAKATILRAAANYFCTEFERGQAGLVVRQRVKIHLGIGTHQRFEPAVNRTLFSHDYAAISNDNLGIHNVQTFWAHAASRLTRDVVCIMFNVLH